MREEAWERNWELNEIRKNTTKSKNTIAIWVSALETTQRGADSIETGPVMWKANRSSPKRQRRTKGPRSWGRQISKGGRWAEHTHRQLRFWGAGGMDCHGEGPTTADWKGSLSTQNSSGRTKLGYALMQTWNGRGRDGKNPTSIKWGYKDYCMYEGTERTVWAGLRLKGRQVRGW